ncbi:MAG TPA: DUF6390 family protein [Actinocrinis sp.]|nr:DUF6390 family protein [Actinocrinis sp.]
MSTPTQGSDTPAQPAGATIGDCTGGTSGDVSGAWMFARYAYAPNKLGFCGPAETGALAAAGSAQLGSADDVRAVARRFSGAWPYLQVLSKLTGIADPLDRRIVEAYWLGGGVGAEISPRDFGAHLLALIGPQASSYWSHLNSELVAEAAGNHCFHVFGVYPWSRLLAAHGVAGPGAAARGDEPVNEPLRVLDNCRIRWGTVVARDGDQVELTSRRLTWDGFALRLGDPVPERVRVSVDGLSFLPDVAPGDQVALHWDWLSDRLRPDQAETLEASTLRQLDATNLRLAAARMGSRVSARQSARPADRPWPAPGRPGPDRAAEAGWTW